MPPDSPALGCRQLGCPTVLFGLHALAWTLPPPAAAAPPIRNKTSMVSPWCPCVRVRVRVRAECYDCVTTPV